MLNWNIFKNNFINAVNTAQIDTPEKLASCIVDNYHLVILQGLNSHQAKPLITNKESMRSILISSLKLNVSNLKVNIPNISNINTNISIPTIPNIPIKPNLPFPLKLPSIPSISLPTPPTIPGIPSIGIPSIPNISIPKINISPLPKFPSIPSISLPTPPTIPGIPSIGIPSIPNISIPNILQKNIKIYSNLSISLKLATQSFWGGASFSLIPPPGAVVPISNQVTNPGLCPIIKLEMKNTEQFVNSLINVFKKHILTIQGINISYTYVGGSLIPISYPWVGIF